MADVADDKHMKLRYAGVCRLCHAELPARTEAIYERGTKTVRCLDCDSIVPPADQRRGPEPLEVEPHVRSDPSTGAAGASARREFDRRKLKREERVRSQHPKIGGLLLGITDDPQSTRAWEQGAVGEERLGTRLDSLVSEKIAVLHDRRIPGTRANIDHIVVTGSRIWVIDAKRYSGRPELGVEGGLFRPRVEKLLVDRRDRTKLVDGVLKQVDLVQRTVGPIPVSGVLCFVDADWPLIGGAFATRGVQVMWPKRLAKLMTEEEASGLDVSVFRQLIENRFKPS